MEPNTRMKYVHYDPQDVNLYHPTRTNLIAGFAIHKDDKELIFDISFAALNPKDAVHMHGPVSYESFRSICDKRLKFGCNSVVPYWLWHHTIALFDDLLNRFPDHHLWFSGHIPLPDRMVHNVSFYIFDGNVPVIKSYPVDILKHYLIYGGIEQPPFRSRVNNFMVVA